MFFPPKTDDCYTSEKYRIIKYTIALIGVFFILFSLGRITKIMTIDVKWAAISMVIISLVGLIIISTNLSCLNSLLVAESATVFVISFGFVLYYFRTKKETIHSSTFDMLNKSSIERINAPELDALNTKMYRQKL